MSSSTTVVVLVAAYLALGLASGAGLKLRGQPWSVAGTSVIAWPLLIGLWTQGADCPGPFASKIGLAFDEVAEAMRDPATAGLLSQPDLTQLRASLDKIDARLGMVDRLLAHETLRDDPLRERLRAERTRAAAEVDAVLEGLLQLKLQLGLLGLVGDTLPARERMRELCGRVRALEELSLS